MPTMQAPAPKALPHSFPQEVTYTSGYDPAGEAIVQRAGIRQVVRMASPTGEIALVTDKDARHNLVPLGWRPIGADEDPTAKSAAAPAARTPKETS